MTLARRPAEPGSHSTLRRSRKPSKRSLDPVAPEVYALVMRRDRTCIADPILGPRCSGRAVWHHRLPVEHGGPSTPENGARVCTLHHTRLHNMRNLAYSTGILLRRGEDPATTPLRLARGPVLLLPDGRYGEAG